MRRRGTGDTLRTRPRAVRLTLRGNLPVPPTPSTGPLRGQGLRPRAGRFASRHSQHDDQEDQNEVAGKDKPRRDRILLQRQTPVAVGKPELRQHERDGEHRRGGQAAPPADERYERQQPDEKLRREHLAEGDESRYAGGRVADEPLLRRGTASERDPQGKERESLQDGLDRPERSGQRAALVLRAVAQ